MTQPVPDSRRRRWWFVLALVLTVVAAVVVALFTSPGRRFSEGRPEWQPPDQTSLTESLQVQPVAGWRLSVAELGLPAGDAADPSKIDATNPPGAREAFIGYLGDRGYFLASSPGTPTPQWWLVGLDVHEGRRLFPAVPFDVADDYPPRCFLNGPTAVLCVHDRGDNPTAWVIDAQTGAVSFTGPTQLEAFMPTATARVRQVGIYAVAETMNRGISGIGPKAELTWFVPGDGAVAARQPSNSDLPRQIFTSQKGAGRGVDKTVVFSVVDGTIVTPELEPGTEQETTLVHPGGFAAEVATKGDRRVTLPVTFFHRNGERVSRRDVNGSLRGPWQDVPIIQRKGANGGNYSAYSPDGGVLAEMTLDAGLGAARLVGSRLFVSANPVLWDAWLQYDLTTGKQGQSCNVGMRDDYLGTNGSTAAFTFGGPYSGVGTVARDLDTCETLWRVEPKPGSFRRVWRVNTSLVELSDDGTELFSLVAPH